MFQLVYFFLELLLTKVRTINRKLSHPLICHGIIQLLCLHLSPQIPKSEDAQDP